jgi:hypothetical protein
MRRPKFNFYEQVRISSPGQKDRKLHGKTGYVMGRTANASGRWGYAVLVEELDECWDLPEGKLSPTGRSKKREDFYSGDSLRVRVDKHGHGDVVKPAPSRAAS